MSPLAPDPNRMILSGSATSTIRLTISWTSSSLGLPCFAMYSRWDVVMLVAPWCGRYLMPDVEQTLGLRADLMVYYIPEGCENPTDPDTAFTTSRIGVRWMVYSVTRTGWVIAAQRKESIWANWQDQGC